MSNAVEVEVPEELERLIREDGVRFTWVPHVRPIQWRAYIGDENEYAASPDMLTAAREIVARKKA